MVKLFDYIKSDGMIQLVKEVKRWSEVEVVYHNGEYEDSEIFLIEDILTEKGQRKLEELFNDFCERDGLKIEYIHSVCIKNTSDTKEMPMVIMASA